MKISTLIFTCLFTLLLSACGNSSSTHTLKIAATSVPHEEILEFVKSDLEKEGIHVEVIVVEDYNIPNRALADKEVDANFFQHPVFLVLQVKDFGYPLEILGAVHLEPMGLYSHSIKTLADVKDRSKVAIPADTSNQARALELMEQAGLVTLRHNGRYSSILDIMENPRHLEFIEIDSPMLTRSLDDVDLAAITTNFALQGGLDPRKDSLAQENSHSAFVNVVVIRKGESERADLQALMKTLNSEKVRQFIKERYKGAVIPAF